MRTADFRKAVADAKQEGKYRQVEEWLLQDVAKREKPFETTDAVVSSWPYEQLANLYKQQQRWTDEVAILTQQLGPGRRQRHISEFVDDEQLHGLHVTLELEQAPLVACFHQLIDECGGGREQHRAASLAGCQAQRECDMRLASAAVVLPVPLVPRAMMFSRRRMYSQRASSSTSILLSAGMAVKSKVSKFFTAGNRAARIRHSTVRRSRSMSSSSIRRSK